MSVYLERYAYPHRLIPDPPNPDVEICVVIPSYNEPDINSTLQALTHCDSIAGKVEVIIVVNESTADPPPVRKQNKITMQAIKKWNDSNRNDLIFHPVHQTLPEKQAGVGLARKIGMDEACRRFNDLGRDGIIACLDADCTCEPDYLKAIQHHFKAYPKTPGCAIYFEHPLAHYAIAAYELHLRYYTHGLRYSGLPCAFQTVGSAMAVRCSAYEKQGGMSRRKAGEDFYFLQKIIKLGGVTELRDTTVYPSSRHSHRVPFGTGKAMNDYQRSATGKLSTYHPYTFQDLQSLVRQVPKLYGVSTSQTSSTWEAFSNALQGFIPKEDFIATIEDLNRSTSTEITFKNRFYQWCDGFLAFKFSNYARSHHYPAVDIKEAASWLLKAAYKVEIEENEVMALLMRYRLLDSKGNSA